MFLGGSRAHFCWFTDFLSHLDKNARNLANVLLYCKICYFWCLLNAFRFFWLISPPNFTKISQGFWVEQENGNFTTFYHGKFDYSNLQIQLLVQFSNYPNCKSEHRISTCLRVCKPNAARWILKFPSASFPNESIIAINICLYTI